MSKLMVKGSTGESSRRGPSANIWADCPWMHIINDPNKGYQFFDDFLTAYDFATNTAVANTGPYEIFTGNGASLAGAVNAQGGVQNFVSGASADVAAIMTLGGGAPFVFGPTIAKKLWFETRVKFSSVTTSDQVPFFIGFGEEDRSAANGIHADAGGDLGFTSTIDLLGFGRFDDDGDSVSFVYQKASQTCQDVLQLAIAADTWVKLGFIYDPAEVAARRIKVFKDGAEQSTYVTATQMAAATFPDGEEMTLLAGVQNDSTTTNTIGVDWWRACQRA
jgi:hypothetical protein